MTAQQRMSRLLVTVLGCACLQVAEADSLLVVRKSDHAVDFIEPGSGARLMSVDVGQTPHEISVSPDGRRAVVSNYGTEDEPGQSISLLDLEQPRELERIDLGRHTRPHGIAWYSPDRVAVTTEGSQHLLLIDANLRRVVAEIPTGQSVSHMVAVTRDGTRAFVANIDSGTTTVVDLSTQRKLQDIATGAGSEAIAIRPDGSEVWVAARSAGHIAIVDAATLEIRQRLELAGVPIRIAFTPDGRTVFVSCATSSEVVAIDVQRRNVIARRRIDLPLTESAKNGPYAKFAPGSALPVGLSVAPDSRHVYVAATMADAVLELALPGLDVGAVIAVPGEPDGLGRSPLLPKYECHACSSDGGTADGGAGF